jgi:predicted RNA-binding protein with PUA-like domain
MKPQHWLMKTEPESFSITDLARVRIEPWTGVRNYMARNHMRRMQVGDRVLFHHSSCDPPGVAGLARVVRVGVVDETQFDPSSKYYDPKATREKPIWDCVEVEYVETLPTFVELATMRADPALAAMVLLKRGMRLSVQPATAAEYARIVKLGNRKPAPVTTRAASRKSSPRPSRTGTKSRTARS